MKTSTTIRLWFMNRETEKARLYSKTVIPNADRDIVEIWIPKSIIEHTSKRGNEHYVTLPDWFVEKEGL